MNPYPVVRCQNPKRIMNPYTKEWMVVPCGHCRACALNRSSSLQLWCDLESQSNEYTLFITLTYANRFVPRLQVLDSIVRPFGHDLVTTDGEILCECDIPEKDIESIKKKCHLFGHIPYLRKDDLQKFLKRFRYYVSKVSKAKVRYFAAGEYGPVHYRPHFHILLFFSDPAILEISQQAVFESWPFGRCDVQLSKGSVSNYVAGYVNSYCALPQIYKQDALRPFNVHSQRLGFSVLQKPRKEIYESSVDDFIYTGITLNGKYREFSVPRSFYAYYYPKCKGFATSNASQRLESYRIYDTSRKAFPGCESAIELAKTIASCNYFFPKDKETFLFDTLTYSVCKYFYDYDSLQCDIDSKSFQLYVQRIYIELLRSRHFLYFVCDNLSVEESKRKIALIEKFYSRLDYLHLLDFFRSQSAFFDSHLYGDEDLMSNEFGNNYYPYFYDNVNNDLVLYKTTPAFQLMDSEIAKKYYDRIKHKELYDQTGFMVYD